MLIQRLVQIFTHANRTAIRKVVVMPMLPSVRKIVEVGADGALVDHTPIEVEE